MANIGVLGAGSWGIALASVLSDNAHNVEVWSVLPEEIEMLKTHHEHKTKLPGVTLKETVSFTTNLAHAVTGKDLLVLAVPSSFIRGTAKQAAPYVAEGQLIVNVAKGIEETTLMPMVDIIMEEIPKAQVAVLSGPSHAEEVGRRLPSTVVAGSQKRETAEYIQGIFMNEVFRVYTSSDVLGIELGGSLKNVIALAAGMADGLGYGDNTKAALITRGISEISRLAIAMGAKAETLGGLSGIGDLIVTCASQHSRNRKAGVLIGQGMDMQSAMDEVKMVVEGVYSAKAAIALGKKYHVPLPITEEVNHVLFDGVPAKEAVSNLMLRERRPENTSSGWN